MKFRPVGAVPLSDIRQCFSHGQLLAYRGRH